MSGPRKCRCGCGTSLDGRRRTCVWASDGCRKAFERGLAPANADKTRTRRAARAPELRVSYRKAVDAVSAHFPAVRRGFIEEAVAAALSPRQQKQLTKPREET